MEDVEDLEGEDEKLFYSCICGWTGSLRDLDVPVCPECGGTSIVPAMENPENENEGEREIED